MFYRYSDFMYSLYISNELLLSDEKKRYDKDFKMDDEISPRSPTMYGNKYEKSESGKIKVTPEERSYSVAYI